jgi:sigma-B regulation protein RsbU (phosphoserine phosphatase)
LQGIFWDITAQKLTEERIRQAQESLRESEALYHSLVETMPQGVFRRDLEGRFTFVNQPYCKYHGIKADDLIGKTDFDLYPPAAAEKYWADDLRVIQNGETMDVIEESRPVAVGETRYLHVIKSPLRDAGGAIIGLQGMFWDISEQKLAEQRIRRANEELAASQEKLRLKNEQMEEDLKVAGEIQAAMLPHQLPTFPRGVPPADSAFQFTHRYRPTGAVGGDFFNVTALSDTEAAVFICDVAGHDVRSALVTAMIRALLEELRPLAHDPGHFLTKLNQDLGAILNHAGTPVLTTAFYLVADSATGILRFANAGHPKPLLIRRQAGSIEPMANAGTRSQAALGVFERTIYHTTEITFGPPDLVMLFTDGLYEVQNPAGDLYTQALLTAAARAGSRLPTGQLFDSLLEEIRQFAGTHQFDDDVCLVGVERSLKP